MRKHLSFFLFLLVFLPAACGQSRQREVTSAAADTIYQIAPAPNPDGTGKVYQGREIAQTMSHFGAAWLERAERLQEERTDLLMQWLKSRVKPTDAVADVGAGSGYFSFRLARLVPQGKVYAQDIQPEMLAIIQTKKEKNRIANVDTVLGTITTPNLPGNRLDWVLLVDAYHEFSHPHEMMRGLVQALKPGGKVVLLEYRAEDPGVPIKPLHKMTEAQAKKEMAFVGLRWLETRKNLPWQHLMVFEKK